MKHIMLPAGPRSKIILTSGLERLAPGEELPSPQAPSARLAERRSSGVGDRVASDIDSDEELSLDDSSQQPGVSRSSGPSNPLTPYTMICGAHVCNACNMQYVKCSVLQYSGDASLGE